MAAEPSRNAALSVRPPAGDDLADVLALLQTAEIAVFGESDWTEQGLRDEWDDLDLARDAWLVSVDGEKDPPRTAGFSFSPATARSTTSTAAGSSPTPTCTRSSAAAASARRSSSWASGARVRPSPAARPSRRRASRRRTS